jgi:uncharacterized protein YgiM (DUF1202 family)
MNRRNVLKAAFTGGAILLAGPASGIAPLLGNAAAQNGDQQRLVIVDRLNLRSGPGTDYTVVTVLSRGDIVSIAGGTEWANGYEWVKVAVWGTGIVGWVTAQYLGEGSGTGYPADRVRVADGPLNVRSAPSLGGAIVTTVPTGTYATVLDMETVRAGGYTWINVQLDNRDISGWMAMEFLSYIDVA